MPGVEEFGVSICLETNVNFIYRLASFSLSKWSYLVRSAVNKRSEFDGDYAAGDHQHWIGHD